MRRGFAPLALLTLSSRLALADERVPLPEHETVVGTDITEVESASGERLLWSSLRATNVPPGPRTLAFTLPRGTPAVRIPVCAGTKRVLLDGIDVHAPPGPVVVDVPRDGAPHRVAMVLEISGYEHRIACGEPPRVGERRLARDGLFAISFRSPDAAQGGGQAVLYVPPGHDLSRPATLLLGLHPWNGTPWTYAAYPALLDAARDHHVVLFFPSGLGNSLYTENAENEVWRALAALAERLPVDPNRLTIWGASMGGAGATTIGFHHPDRFAAIVSLFGDSKYDLSTYVHRILKDGLGAHRVSAFDVVDNARNVPVWLIHGEDDRVSPLAQSAMLARALKAAQFAVTFDRVPQAGHEGRVVSEFAGRIVALAAQVRRVTAPTHVSYRSVLPSENEAYGIRLTRSTDAGDAFFDLERVGAALHVRSAEGLRALRLPRGAFGFDPRETPSVVVDDPNARGVLIAWDPLP